jgi:hypothetical protein
MAILGLQDGPCEHASCALSACQNRDDTDAIRDASWEKRRGKCVDHRQDWSPVARQSHHDVCSQLPCRRSKDGLDLNATIPDVLALARSAVQRHGVMVKTHLAKELPRMLGDRIQV